jgi:RNA-directed DNA polymerase
MNLQDGQRRNIQQELDFSSDRESEAQNRRREETESSGASYDHKSQSETKPTMEEICELKNLKEAVHQVWANKGSAGIDGRTVEQRPSYEELTAIREQLLSGRYKPQPVRRVEIPKPDGGVRKLGIPTVMDRIVQQAVMHVLQQHWDRTFSDSSYGFRPGRGAQEAVEQAQRHIAAGYGWVVDLDLEKFFDRVNHDKLMGRLAQRIEDKRLLRLIRAFLNAGVVDNGLVSPTVEGTPQGGPLSPLLSNVVLDDLDRELEQRGLRFVRYADDCNIYVRTPRAGQRVMDSVRRYITNKLKLKVNEAKSAVAQPQQRKFLGFSFTDGPEIRRRIAPKALERFKERILGMIQPARGVSLKTIMAKLAPYLQGWNSYFGFCQTPSVLEKLNRWIRHRLRCAIWRQWKTATRRRRALIHLGVPAELARKAATSGRGPWRLSACLAVQQGLSNNYFHVRGLPSLWSHPHLLDSNRRVRTRTHGGETGVGG